MSIPQQIERQAQAAQERIMANAPQPQPDGAEQGELDTVTATADAPNTQPANQPVAQETDVRSELEKAEQRHRTLAGMLRSKDEEIKQLRALMSQMNEKVDNALATKRPSSDSEAKYRADFGDDLVDMVLALVRANTAR